MYIPESDGCARASCSVWVPARGGGDAPGTSEQAPAPSPHAHSPKALPDSQSRPRFGEAALLSHRASELGPQPQFTHQAGGRLLLPWRGPGCPCIPRDFRARVSVDLAWEGDAAVEDGGDLLRVQTRDSWWDCPRGHQDKERHMTTHTGRERTARVRHRAFTSSWSFKPHCAAAPICHNHLTDANTGA